MTNAIILTVGLFIAAICSSEFVNGNLLRLKPIPLNNFRPFSACDELTSGNVDFKMDSFYANITWNRTLYERDPMFVVYDEATDEHVSAQTENETNGNITKTIINIADMQSCTKYGIEMRKATKKYGYDDKYIYNCVRCACTLGSFITKPDARTGSHLDLNKIMTTADTISVGFHPTNTNVNCLSDFTIRTCKNNKDCIHSKNFFLHETTNMGANLVHYESKGLDHCTQYSLHIQPVYPGIRIKPRILNTTTTWDEYKSVQPQFNDIPGGLQIMVKNIACFQSYSIRYNLKTSVLSVGFDHGLLRFNKSEPIILHGLLPNSLYEFSMVGHISQQEGWAQEEVFPSSRSRIGKDISIFGPIDHKTMELFNPMVNSQTSENYNITDGEDIAMERSLTGNP